MTFERFVVLVVVLFMLVPKVFLPSASADPMVDVPAVQEGAVTLAANVAQAVVTPLQNRRAVGVQNLNATEVFCGFSSGVTTLTGWYIPQYGSASFDLSSKSGTLTLYCITTVLQTTTTNLRFKEIR